MLMWLICLFVYLTYGDNCSNRTNTYKSHGTSNDKYWYYDPRSYTQSILPTNTSYYRTWIQNTVSCIGEWCVQNRWMCLRNNSHCYHVEHIIPRRHNIREIAECSVDVLGNYIMANGIWNRELSNKFLGEKAEIYGDIFKYAYVSVYKACFDIYPIKLPVELCIKN